MLSSNVPETDEAEWVSTTAYTAGQRVMVTDPGVHMIYEALADSTGKYPPDNTGGDTPAWLEVGATNRWSMFDGVVGTSTESSEPFPDGSGQGIQVQIEPGQVINSLAFFGLNGNSLSVTMTDATEGEVYSHTENLVSTEGITDWYAYYFEPIERRSDVVLTDIPSYGTATLTISINSPASPAACSLAIPGTQRDLGGTRYGAGVGIIDYSRKETDPFGRFLITKRPYSKRMSLDLIVEKNRVDYVQRLLGSIRAEPVVWSGHETYGALLVYGYYRDFDIIIDNFSFSECSIEIEGLT
ncbi:hypothetical protein BIS06_14155 [Halomonas sp. BBD48]|nr:hypothetical protein [Halomonas sp. BBD48]